MTEEKRDYKEPVGTPESTVKPIDPNDPKGATDLVRASKEEFRKAEQALVNMPPPPKTPPRR